MVGPRRTQASRPKRSSSGVNTRTFPSRFIVPNNEKTRVRTRFRNNIKLQVFVEPRSVLSLSGTSVYYKVSSTLTDKEGKVRRYDHGSFTNRKEAEAIAKFVVKADSLRV